jgi:RNase H-like domain found in reverse transcriptase/Reverse transcriptase (RNA-dependent DNA polymerase)
MYYMPCDEIVVFHIENGKKAHYIALTTRPASWGNKDLNPQMKDEKKKTPEEMVPKQFHKYMKVFLKKASERMPTRKPWDHTIEIKPSFEPKKAKNIPLSPQEQREVEEFLNDQLSKGYIWESKSPQTSAVFFIPKKDLRKHMVQDYRYLNSWTIQNNYLLPLINELVDKVGKAKYFTKFDLCWGYNNVQIKKGDKWKAAFTTHRGVFEPVVMYFGLMNSPATFQMMMNSIMWDLIDQGVVVVYIDDILIFTMTEKEHDKIVEEVLKQLEENDLFLKPEKCIFKEKEFEFLGLYIGPDGIKMDEVKTKAITDWLTPQKVKDVQWFLGLANFYHHFVEGFSKIVTPLNKLLRKEQSWEWMKEQQNVFDMLKECFTINPILTMPNPEQELRIESDTSYFATGAVLSMKCEDEKWRPCAYYSKSLSDVERNYDIHDKEMLSIMRALEQWWHHLEGAKLKFKIWSDHQNLQYFMGAKKLNRRQARWALYLSRFDFEMVNKPGASMGKANALSRRPDHKEGVKNDNKEVMLLKPEFFAICALQQGHFWLTEQKKDY